MLAEGPHPAELWPLLDEAAPYLEQRAVETDLATFYQELAKMAERPHLAACATPCAIGLCWAWPRGCVSYRTGKSDRAT